MQLLRNCSSLCVCACVLFCFLEKTNSQGVQTHDASSEDFYNKPESFTLETTAFFMM